MTPTTDLTSDAAWVLTATFVLSLAYEFYRATCRTGDSEYDSIRAFVQQLPLYGAAAGVIVVLLIGEPWATWIGLAFCAAVIAVSILYYNPRIMPARRPGRIDWFEDLVFTGLLFVAAAQLQYELANR
jgi:phosphatidylserine synthase